jgi:3-oxoacyl-[acyl-carrier-protein] synthase II
MVAGKNGIGLNTRFDTTEYKAKLDAEVKNFDPLAYMEKPEVLRSDPYARYALASAVQAVEESGIIGTVDSERFAVYFGSGIGGISTITAEHNKLLNRGPGRVSPFFVPMMIANMAAGLIAIRYNCQGPALPAVTACASGSNAIGEAVRLIRHGYADAAVTGGAEAAITECGVAGFINMQALSTSDDPDAASLPFDRRRAGFVIGEGAAALVLEEYGHAVKRGAKIYAEVVGYGSTCDAYHITAPSPDANGGRRAMQQALGEAGYTGDDSLYINAHGTGTPLNDKGETLAIKAALGGDAAKKALVSSTKSMTGHMLGAAGAIEAIVCIKALETGIIPPTIHLLEPDEDCDLDYVPNVARKANITLALSNSLGFGGHNATLAFRRV